MTLGKAWNSGPTGPGTSHSVRNVPGPETWR